MLTRPVFVQLIQGTSPVGLLIPRALRPASNLTPLRGPSRPPACFHAIVYLVVPVFGCPRIHVDAVTISVVGLVDRSCRGNDPGG